MEKLPMSIILCEQILFHIKTWAKTASDSRVRPVLVSRLAYVSHVSPVRFSCVSRLSDLHLACV